MKTFLGVLLAVSVFTLLVTLGAGLVALDPSDLDFDEIQRAKPIAVKIPDSKTHEELPPPPAEPVKSNLMADLAPESFSQSLKELGGVGFGSGGQGPGIGGRGGFGDDANNLVGERTSIDKPPRALTKTPPDYPTEARTRGVSGFVILKILVGQNGVIENIRIEKSEPAGFFDQAALKSVQNWRFEPGVSKGQAVAAWTTQKIKFELN